MGCVAYNVSSWSRYKVGFYKDFTKKKDELSLFNSIYGNKKEKYIDKELVLNVYVEYSVQVFDEFKTDYIAARYEKITAASLRKRSRTKD